MPGTPWCVVVMVLGVTAASVTTSAAQSPAAAASMAPDVPPTAAAQLDIEISFLESRLGRDEADPITPTRLGHAYLKKARESGDFSTYARAEATFDLALKRSPQHLGALIGLATALSARHAFREALATAERAIAANPGSIEAYAAAGDAALEAGLLDTAAVMYARVAAQAPGYHTETRLANLAAARGDRKAVYAALGRAVVDAEQRGLDPALIAWCHVRAGSVAWENGDWTRADASYRAALTLTPASYAALEHLAELRAAQGQHDEALALYARAIAISPQPEFHQAVGAIHQARGRSAEAATAYRLAREGLEAAAAAGDPGAYRPLALFHADIAGAPVQALAWAQKDYAVRQDAITLGVLAWTLLKTGDLTGAAAAANRAVHTRPVDADTWYRAGVVALASGAAVEGRRRLRRALEINSRFGWAADATRRLRMRSTWSSPGKSETLTEQARPR